MSTSISAPLPVQQVVIVKQQPGLLPGLLVPPVIDSAVDFRIDGSAMTEMHRDRETDCREEVCGDAQR